MPLQPEEFGLTTLDPIIEPVAPPPVEVMPLAAPPAEYAVPDGWVGPPPTVPINSSQIGLNYLEMRDRNEKGRMGFLEGISEWDKEDIPFMGHWNAASHINKQVETLKKLQSGVRPSDEELFDLNFYIQTAKRLSDAKILGKVGTGLKNLVTFMSEFLAMSALIGATPAIPDEAAAAGAQVGGVASKTLAKETFRQMASRYAQHFLAKSTAANASRFAKVGYAAADIGTRGLIYTAMNPGLAAQGRAQQRMKQIVETGEIDEKRALMLGFVDAWVEHASEASGFHLGRLAGAVLPTRLSDLVVGHAAHRTLAKTKDLSKTAKFFNWVQVNGANGIVEEMAEERLGGFLRGLTGVEGKAGLVNAVDQMIPTWEQAQVEFLTFSVPAAVVMGGSRIGRAEFLGGVNFQQSMDNAKVIERGTRPGEEPTGDREVVKKGELAIATQEEAEKVAKGAAAMGALAGFQQKVLGRQLGGIRDTLQLKRKADLVGVYLSFKKRNLDAGKSEAEAQDAAMDAVAFYIQRMQGQHTRGIVDAQHAETFNRLAKEGKLVEHEIGRGMTEWTYSKDADFTDPEIDMLLESGAIKHLPNIEELDARMFATKQPLRSADMPDWDAPEMTAAEEGEASLQDKWTLRIGNLVNAVPGDPLIRERVKEKYNELRRVVSAIEQRKGKTPTVNDLVVVDSQEGSLYRVMSVNDDGTFTVKNAEEEVVVRKEETEVHTGEIYLIDDVLVEGTPEKWERVNPAYAIDTERMQPTKPGGNVYVRHMNAMPSANTGDFMITTGGAAAGYTEDFIEATRRMQEAVLGGAEAALNIGEVGEQRIQRLLQDATAERDKLQRGLIKSRATKAQISKLDTLIKNIKENNAQFKFEMLSKIESFNIMGKESPLDPWFSTLKRLELTDGDPLKLQVGQNLYNTIGINAANRLTDKPIQTPEPTAEPIEPTEPVSEPTEPVEASILEDAADDTSGLEQAPEEAPSSFEGGEVSVEPELEIAVAASDASVQVLEAVEEVEAAVTPEEGEIARETFARRFEELEALPVAELERIAVQRGVIQPGAVIAEEDVQRVAREITVAETTGGLVEPILEDRRAELAEAENLKNNVLTVLRRMAESPTFTPAQAEGMEDVTPPAPDGLDEELNDPWKNFSMSAVPLLVASAPIELFRPYTEQQLQGMNIQELKDFLIKVGAGWEDGATVDDLRRDAMTRVPFSYEDRYGGGKPFSPVLTWNDFYGSWQVEDNSNHTSLAIRLADFGDRGTVPNDPDLIQNAYFGLMNEEEKKSGTSLVMLRIDGQLYAQNLTDQGPRSLPFGMKRMSGDLWQNYQNRVQKWREDAGRPDVISARTAVLEVFKQRETEREEPTGGRIGILEQPEFLATTAMTASTKERIAAVKKFYQDKLERARKALAKPQTEEAKRGIQNRIDSAEMQLIALEGLEEYSDGVVFHSKFHDFAMPEWIVFHPAYPEWINGELTNEEFAQRIFEIQEKVTRPTTRFTVVDGKRVRVREEFIVVRSRNWAERKVVPIPEPIKMPDENGDPVETGEQGLVQPLWTKKTDYEVQSEERWRQEQNKKITDRNISRAIREGTVVLGEPEKVKMSEKPKRMPPPNLFGLDRTFRVGNKQYAYQERTTKKGKKKIELFVRTLDYGMETPGVEPLIEPFAKFYWGTWIFEDIEMSRAQVEQKLGRVLKKLLYPMALENHQDNRVASITGRLNKFIEEEMANRPTLQKLFADGVEASEITDQAVPHDIQAFEEGFQVSEDVSAERDLYRMQSEHRPGSSFLPYKRVKSEEPGARPEPVVTENKEGVLDTALGERVAEIIPVSPGTTAEFIKDNMPETVTVFDQVDEEGRSLNRIFPPGIVERRGKGIYDAAWEKQFLRNAPRMDALIIIKADPVLNYETGMMEERAAEQAVRGSTFTPMQSLSISDHQIRKAQRDGRITPQFAEQLLRTERSRRANMAVIGRLSEDGESYDRGSVPLLVIHPDFGLSSAEYASLLRGFLNVTNVQDKPNVSVGVFTLNQGPRKGKAAATQVEQRTQNFVLGLRDAISQPGPSAFNWMQISNPMKVGDVRPDLLARYVENVGEPIREVEKEAAAPSVDVEEAAPVRREPMSFRMAAHENVTGEPTTTLRLIQEGVRTATTRHWPQGVPAVGTVIEFFDNAGNTARVRVTGSQTVGEVKARNPQGFIKELATPEAWTADAYRHHYNQGRTVNDSSTQIQFELIEPEQAPTTLSAEDVTLVDDLRASNGEKVAIMVRDGQILVDPEDIRRPEVIQEVEPEVSRSLRELGVMDILTENEELRTAFLIEHERVHLDRTEPHRDPLIEEMFVSEAALRNLGVIEPVGEEGVGVGRFAPVLDLLDDERFTQEYWQRRLVETQRYDQGFTDYPGLEAEQQEFLDSFSEEQREVFSVIAYGLNLGFMASDHLDVPNWETIKNKITHTSAIGFRFDPFVLPKDIRRVRELFEKHQTERAIAAELARHVGAAKASKAMLQIAPTSSAVAGPGVVLEGRLAAIEEIKLRNRLVEPVGRLRPVRVRPIEQLAPAPTVEPTTGPRGIPDPAALIRTVPPRTIRREIQERVEPRLPSTADEYLDDQTFSFTELETNIHSISPVFLSGPVGMQVAFEDTMRRLRREMALSHAEITKLQRKMGLVPQIGVIATPVRDETGKIAFWKTTDPATEQEVFMADGSRPRTRKQVNQIDRRIKKARPKITKAERKRSEDFMRALGAKIEGTEIVVGAKETEVSPVDAANRIAVKSRRAARSVQRRRPEAIPTLEQVSLFMGLQQEGLIDAKLGPYEFTEAEMIRILGDALARRRLQTNIKVFEPVYYEKSVAEIEAEWNQFNPRIPFGEYRDKGTDSDGNIIWEAQPGSLLAEAVDLLEKARVNENEFTTEFINPQEEWIGKRQRYIKHLYENSQEEATKKKITDMKKKFRFKEESSASQERRFETYEAAAAAYGLVPISQMRFDDLYLKRANDVWRAAANKAMITNMVLQRDFDGSPAVLPRFNETMADLPAESVRSVLSDETVFLALDALVDHMNMEYMRQGSRKRVSVNREGDPRKQMNKMIDKFIADFDAAQKNFTTLKADQPNFTSFIDFHVRKGPAENVMKKVVDTPYEGTMATIIQTFNSVTKEAGLALSLFHPVALLESLSAIYGLKLTNPAAPWNWADTWFSATQMWRKSQTDPEFFADWIEAGLVVSSIDPNLMIGPNSQAGFTGRFLDGIKKKDLPALSWGADKIGRFRTWNAGLLWGRFHPTLKLYVAEHVLNEVAKEPARWGYRADFSDRDQAMRDIAQLTNDALGGQEFEQHMWATPKVKQMLHMVFFAPDWSLSAMKIAGTLPGLDVIFNPTASELQKEWGTKRYWPGMALIVMFMIPNAVQSMIYAAAATAGVTDDDDKPFIWQNEVGKDSGPFGIPGAGYIDITPLMKMLALHKGGETGRRRVYLRFAKQATEIFEGWFTRPLSQAKGKMSSAARTVLEQATAKNTAGWDLDFQNEGFSGIFAGDKLGVWGGRWAYVGRKFLPLSVLSWLDGKPAAFVAPTSRGMSKGAAQRKMAEILMAYADEDTWDRIVDFPKRKENLAALFPELMDAVERNGYDEWAVFAAAKRNVLGSLYNDFYNALNKGKDRELEKIASGILRVHGTIEGMQKSLKRRYANAGKDFPPDLFEKANQAFVDAQGLSANDFEFSTLSPRIP